MNTIPAIPNLEKPDTLLVENECVALAVLGVLSECSLWGQFILDRALRAEMKRDGIIPVITGGKCLPTHVVLTFEAPSRMELIECLRRTLHSWELLNQSEIAFWDRAEGYWRKVHASSNIDFQFYFEGDGYVAIEQSMQRFETFKQLQDAFRKSHPET